MSLTKRNPAFDRMMEEHRAQYDHSVEEYLENEYLQSTNDPPVRYGKQRPPSDDEQPETINPPKGN